MERILSRPDSSQATHPEQVTFRPPHPDRSQTQPVDLTGDGSQPGNGKGITLFRIEALMQALSDELRHKERLAASTVQAIPEEPDDTLSRRRVLKAASYLPAAAVFSIFISRVVEKLPSGTVPEENILPVAKGVLDIKDIAPDTQHQIMYGEGQIIDRDPLKPELNAYCQLSFSQQAIDSTLNPDKQDTTYTFYQVCSPEEGIYSKSMFEDDNPPPSITIYKGSVLNGPPNALTFLPLNVENGKALIRIRTERTRFGERIDDEYELTYPVPYHSEKNGTIITSLVNPNQDHRAKEGIKELDNFFNKFKDSNVTPHIIITPDSTGYIVTFNRDPESHKTKLGLVIGVEDLAKWQTNVLYAIGATELEHMRDNPDLGNPSQDFILNKLVGDFNNVINYIAYDTKDTKKTKSDNSDSGDNLGSPVPEVFLPEQLNNSDNFSRATFLKASQLIIDFRSAFGSWMAVMGAGEILTPGSKFLKAINQSCDPQHARLFFTAGERIYRRLFPNQAKIEKDHPEDAIFPRLPEVETESLIADNEYNSFIQTLPVVPLSQTA